VRKKCGTIPTTRDANAQKRMGELCLFLAREFDSIT
jgi:hypothetical protein